MTYKITTGDLSPIVLNQADPVESVLQNIRVLLRTWQGTVPLYREFGVDAEILHKPVTVARNLLYAELREKIERYEPRVHVKNVTFEETEVGLIPTVEVEIHGEES